jgi:hypothetical protein
MTDSAKSRILALAKTSKLTDSCGALLYQAALPDGSLTELTPPCRTS